MFCFNIPLCNPTEAADIVFSKFNACAVTFTVFVFWPGHSTTKCQACFWMFLFCFEVVNQRENYERTTFYCEMLSSRMGCSRLLTLCSRFAHALLTLCSRFAHALLTLAEVPFESFRFLLSPYEGLLTVCSRFAHGLLTVCSRCSRFAHALLTLWGIMCLS